MQLCPDTFKSLLLLLSAYYAYSHFVCTSNSLSPLNLAASTSVVQKMHDWETFNDFKDLGLKAQHFNLLKNTPAYGDVTSNWDWLQKDQQFWRQ